LATFTHLLAQFSRTSRAETPYLGFSSIKGKASGVCLLFDIVALCARTLSDPNPM